jgi:FkbM family methyltransferase
LAHEYQPGVGTAPWRSDAAWSNSLRSRFRDVSLRLARRAGLTRRRYDPGRAAERMELLAERRDELAEVYSLLADERSRGILVDVLLMEVLGPWHVPTSISAHDFTARCRALERSHGVDQESVPSPYGHRLPLLRWPLEEGSLRIYAHPLQLVEFFDLEQYAYRQVEPPVAASPGDVVLEAGGGWGDTALYFASAVGAAGRVISVEFVEDNLALLRRNLEANPELMARVEVVPSALWRASGKRLAFQSAGSASALLPATGSHAGAGEVETISIDDLRKEAGRPLDMIKLDVEGAEQEVLAGAAATLAEDRPKLAIAVYHSLDDLIEIPRQLAALEAGYELFLDHTVPGPHETILFARPPG